MNKLFLCLFLWAFPHFCPCALQTQSCAESLSLLTANTPILCAISPDSSVGMSEDDLLAIQENAERREVRSFLVSSLLILFAIVFNLGLVLKVWRWRMQQRKSAIEEHQRIRRYVLKKRQELADAIRREQQAHWRLLRRNARLKEECKLLEDKELQHKKSAVCQLCQACETFRRSRNFENEMAWKDYYRMCETANTHLFMIANRLEATKALNEKEIRLCILVLIGGFSGKRMADLLCYCESGIRNLKSNTARKLGRIGHFAGWDVVLIPMNTGVSEVSNVSTDIS